MKSKFFGPKNGPKLVKMVKKSIFYLHCVSRSFVFLVVILVIFQLFWYFLIRIKNGKNDSKNEKKIGPKMTKKWPKNGQNLHFLLFLKTTVPILPR